MTVREADWMEAAWERWKAEHGALPTAEYTLFLRDAFMGGYVAGYWDGWDKAGGE